MPYNFVGNSFHTENSVAEFLQAKCDRFRAHPLEGLEATYDDHLRLIEKRVVDFLLVLSKLFSLGARCYGRDATSEYRFKIGDFAPKGGG